MNLGVIQRRRFGYRRLHTMLKREGIEVTNYSKKYLGLT